MQNNTDVVTANSWTELISLDWPPVLYIVLAGPVSFHSFLEHSSSLQHLPEKSLDDGQAGQDWEGPKTRSRLWQFANSRGGTGSHLKDTLILKDALAGQLWGVMAWKLRLGNTSPLNKRKLTLKEAFLPQIKLPQRMYTYSNKS